MADIKSWQKPLNSSTLLSCITISIIVLLRPATAFLLSVYVKLLSSSKSWAVAARTIQLTISYYNRCSATLHWQPLMMSFTWRKRNKPITRNFQCFQSQLHLISTSQALWNAKCTRVESLVSFLTRSWCNQNRTTVFRTERQHFVCYSTNFAFNVRCVWYLPPPW